MSITNPQIAQSISDLLDKWWTRENQYQAWLNGTATGGPYGNGTYPLTGTDGVTKYVTCPAALQAQVDGETGSASTFKDQAATSATSASTAATNAANAQSAAEAARDAAALSYQLAETAKANAAGSASNAQVYANNAATSAADSAASAVSIVGDKDAAAASAANALTSEANAAGSETAASGSATAASASATLAGKYATNPEDVIVTGSDYSAYHWAQKARAYSTGTLIYKGAWDATTSYPASPRQGDFYIVSVAGSGYHVGDMVLYDGSAWDKVDNSQTVTSVAGRVGAIVLDKSDVGLANVLNAVQLVAANNFSDVPNKGTALGNLGAYAKSEVDTLLAAKAALAGAMFTGGVSVSSGTSEPLNLITSSAAPWSIKLTRSDLGFISSVYNNGLGWVFQHNLSAPNLSGTNTGDQDLSGLMPKSGGTFTGVISAPNLSGTNTGDETLASIKSKLGISTLSGSNTGDQDLSGLMPKGGGTFTGAVTTGGVTINPADNASPYVSGVRFGDGSGWRYPFRRGDGTVLAYINDSGASVFIGGISASNLSGSNTGDQNLAPYALLTGAAFTGDISRAGGPRYPITFVQSATPTATAAGDLWVW